LAYVPALHALQGVAELESVSAVPAAHETHEVVAPLAYVPAAHALHGVPESESVSALPAAQEVHFTDALGENEPVGHLLLAPSHGVAGFLSWSM
jgi:hypothetical protein